MTITPHDLEQEDDKTILGYSELEEEDYTPDETIADVICLDPMNKKGLSGLDIDTIVTDASGVINASKALVPFIENCGSLFIAESALAEAHEALGTLPKEAHRETVIRYLMTSNHVLNIQEQRRVPEINLEYDLMRKLLPMTRRNATYRCIVDQIDEVTRLWAAVIELYGVSRKGSKVAEDFFGNKPHKITNGREESDQYQRLQELYEGLPEAFGQNVGRFLESLRDKLTVERRALGEYTHSSTAKRMITAEIVDALQQGVSAEHVAGMMKAQYSQPHNDSAVDTVLCAYAHPMHLSGGVASTTGGTAVLSAQSDVKDLVLLRRSMYFK